MSDDTIEAYLGRLSERTAVPAGGTTAALNAAQAAALLAMAARYCDGPRHAGHGAAVGAAIAEADRLRLTCAALMAADGEAYGTVLAAYRLPRDTEAQRTARSAAVAAALVVAAGPPAELIAAAARLLDLAQTLEPLVSRSIAPDLAAAAEAARAAAGASRTNLAANLAGITDPAARDRLSGVIAAAGELEARAGRLIAAVRSRYS